MPTQRTLCFVVDTLANHGAERYLYELLGALDKSRFTCTVFCTKPLEAGQKHYYAPIAALGINIVEYQEDPYPQQADSWAKKLAVSFAYRVRNRFNPVYVHNLCFGHRLAFLQGFDEVSIIKWEVYQNDRALYDALPQKNIHIMSGFAQYGENPYVDLPTAPTRFVLMYDTQQEEVLQGRPNTLFSFVTQPLILDNSAYPNRYRRSKERFEIGLFSRIHYDQPTIFFLSVAHLLKKKGYDFRLNFFGKYADEKFYQFYLNTCKHLDIADEVVFRGHSGDMGQEMESLGLSVGIMNCLGNFIGYSSMEIQSHGLPVLFYNVVPNHTSSNPNAYISLDAMADRLAYFIQHPEALDVFAAQTYADSKNYHNAQQINQLFLAHD